MKKPNQDYAYVSFTVGGSFCILSFEDTQNEYRISHRNSGGGSRGKVTGLSRASRRKLLRRLASIDQDAFKGRVIYLTLTYPDIWPEDSKVCKKHLECFRKRFTRRNGGGFIGVWRVGIQERGAWHFHLFLFLLSSSFESLQELRSFVSRAWYQACGKISEGHLLAGTNVQEIRAWRRVGYVGRYLARPERFPVGTNPGRIWGTWNKHLLPVRWETVRLSVEDADRIRRVYRRLARKKGTGTRRNVQVFVKHENVVRLLRFLKDDNEHPKGARRPLPSREPNLQRNASSGRSSRASRASVSTRDKEN